MSATTHKFHWKVFVSFYVVFSFLALAVSGIVLYIAPPGRIANWSVWQLRLLSKAQWQAVHTIVALMFLVAASFHIYFNWKVLVAYVKRLHTSWRVFDVTGVGTLNGNLYVRYSDARDGGKAAYLLFTPDGRQEIKETDIPAGLRFLSKTEAKKAGHQPGTLRVGARPGEVP